MEHAHSEDPDKRPILIVEDDRDIAEVMAELVRGDGYDARVATDGQEALKRLHESPAPCCILLDLMLPVLSGWDFLETLQDERPEYRDIPVIVVSAAHNPRLPEGVRLLPKPLDLATLTQAIGEATGH
ncbi:MAG: response regulator [Deltaproteobacteria bacterium]|nr:response regulator [Deltaproteobacteria bacterium]